LVVADRRTTDDRRMFAITIPTTTTTVTGQVSRVARWVRGRLAPTGEDLEERANWKIKTRWILGAWAATSAISAVGTALTPALLAFPIVLIALTPRLPFLFIAAATTNPLLFFGVVVPRMIVADPIHIALGRRYGARLVPQKAQRLMLRLGVVGIALRPTSRVLAAAGACKMRTSRILVADVIGTVGLAAGIYFGTTTVWG
jgi:hypothetical protein